MRRAGVCSSWSFRGTVFEIDVTSLFHVAGRGTILAGRVTKGRVAVGDMVDVRSPATSVRSSVAGLERDKEFVPEAGLGADVAILLRDLDPAQIRDGMTADESGGWHVVSLRLHGVDKPWWRFWA
jgi:elongation factor Tu